MVTWRETGFVPDSDEELDGYISTSSSKEQRPSIHLAAGTVHEESWSSSFPLSSSRGERGQVAQMHSIASRPTLKIQCHSEDSASGHNVFRWPKYEHITYEDRETDDLQTNPPSRTHLLKDRKEPNEGHGLSSLPVEAEGESSGESPLSTLSSPVSVSSLATFLRATPKQNASDGNRQSATNQVQVVKDTPRAEGDIGSSVQNEELERSGGRIFRKRKPIQLHPFLLEGEQYRQTLKSRGMRPIHIAFAPVHRRRETTTPDLQYEGPKSGGENDSKRIYEQRSKHTPASTRRTGFALQRAPLGDIMDKDNETANSATLVNRKMGLADQRRHKRRRIHTGSSPLTRDIPTSDHKSAHTMRSSSLADIFSIPPSPPTSRSSPPPSTVLMKISKVPTAFPTFGSPTPVNSSELRPHSGRIIITDSDNDSTNDSDSDIPTRSKFRQRRRRRRVSMNSGSESEQQSPDSDYSNELKRMRRRIKGVLPASWLKLDRKAQTERAETLTRRARSNTAEKSESDRHSVAITRAISCRQTLELSTDNVKTTSSDWEHSDIFRHANHSLVEQIDLRYLADAESGSNADFSAVDIRDGDIPEYDRIDLMRPTGSRSKGRAIPVKKRQTSLIDFGRLQKRVKVLSAKGRDRNGHSSSNKRYEGKITGASKARVTNFDDAPRLSIVDLQQEPVEEGKSIPQFIRLAMRQARRQRDRGRHRPTVKHIRLQTQADTDDAQKVLQSWRSGSLRPSTRSAEPKMLLNTRTPLKDHIDNQQQRLPSAVKMVSSQIANDMESKVSFQRRPPNLKQTVLRAVMKERDDGTTSDNQISVEDVSIPTGSKRLLSKRQMFRHAQLEDLEDRFNLQHRSVAFRQQLRKADTHFRFQARGRPGWTNPQMQNFLETSPAPRSERKDGGYGPSNRNMPNLAERRTPTQRRPRKQPARRLDVNTRDFRQPVDLMPAQVVDLSNEVSTNAQSEEQVLIGLGAYGSRYSVDFDVMPLESGTFFHSSTFLGSSALHDIFRQQRRDMDVPTGYSTVEHEEESYRWGPWDEAVSSELASIFHRISKVLGDSDAERARADLRNGNHDLCKVTAFLRSLISYFSTTLSFLDPIDRRDVVTAMTRLIGQACENLNMRPNLSEIEQHHIQTLMLLFVLSAQILQMAKHPVVVGVHLANCQTLFQERTHDLMRAILTKGMGQLRTYLEENRRHQLRDGGIRDRNYYVEAVVVMILVCDRIGTSATSFWGTVSAQLSAAVKGTNLVSAMESAWYDIFTLLPYGEFDDHGVLRVGLRFRASNEDWKLVTTLVKKVFELYTETSKLYVAALNAYVRAVLGRCCNLVQCWGWRRCEPILNAVFDFFAGNELSHLRNENHRGSPRFLENLHQQPSLQVLEEDRAFHIFLKMLGSGLKGMRGLYPDKKIGGIAWRFIPNHGRTYRKEMSVRQEEIDALRNHHDLLCVLYWASPLDCRPRIDLLRQLVDHTCSHREACRLNVRSWSLLARFQLSTDEPLQCLDGFTSWCREMFEKTMSQYFLARTEAEKEFETAQTEGNQEIGWDMLEATIKSNQIQVLATLSDLVIGVRAALRVSNEKGARTALLRDSGLVSVFRIFDAKQSRADAVVIEALSTLGDYLQSLSNPRTVEDQQSNEESQDYGEFPSLDEIDTGSQPAEVTAREDPVGFLQEDLWHLLSNSFGSETAPSEDLLTKAVDVWLDMARCAVQTQGRHWGSFLDSYSSMSWQQLRDTRQTRIFAIYFMASVLKRDPSAYHDHQAEFRSTWLVSLAERESMLKFQHRLTTELFNSSPHDPLFENPPFMQHSRSGSYDVTASQLRERRLALISTILSNMRESCEQARHFRPQQADSVRREYATLLKQLMGAMRKNYEDMHQGSTVRGAYIEFVQKVVEFIQQYCAADICPVDSFFTDSAAFPLPATDPTYVVGALRSYAPKLSDTKSLKQLAMFFQTLSQRAAVDQQQTYLVSQLHAAMHNMYESGSVSQPSLRSALLLGIFPCYVESAFASDTGWVMARPILQASALIFEDMLFSFSATDKSSVVSISLILEDTLALLCRVTSPVATSPDLLTQPHILSILEHIFHLTTASLPTLDYILRRTNSRHIPTAASSIRRLHSSALFITSHLANTSNDDDDNNNLANPPPPRPPPPITASEASAHAPEPRPPFREVREFCARELRRALGESWARGGQSAGGCSFRVRVGSSVWKDVAVGLGSLEEERERLKGAAEGLMGALRGMEAFGVEVGVGGGMGSGVVEKARRDWEGDWGFGVDGVVVV